MYHTETTLHQITEEELLTAFLPKQNVNELLREYPSLYHILWHASEAQLQGMPGMGREKIKKIQYLREVVTRVQQERTAPMKRIRGSADVIRSFRFLQDRQQEEVWALLLDTKHHILQKRQITIGTVNTCMSAPREFFHAAVQQLAAAVIAVHNHPSGDSSPSTEDTAVTKRLLQIGALLDIPLLDHVIIGKHGCYSFRESMDQVWKEGRYDERRQ
jgi:DNA repair protein RadC